MLLNVDETTDKCKYANEKYYLDNEKKAKACLFYYSTCSNGFSCDSCIEGYYKTVNDSKCVDTDHCYKEGDIEGKCIKAVDGYYLDDQNKTNKCNNLCKTCV